MVEHVRIDIRALASARGSVATRRARGQRARPLEGPEGPRVAKTCESEGPKGPRTSKAQCPFWRLPVLSTLMTAKMHENFSSVSYSQDKRRVKKSKQFVN